MNKKDIFPGMKVRISDDLSITHKRCTANSSMRRMRNKVYTVKKISSRDLVHIYNNISTTSYWSFAIEDLLPVELPYQELKTTNLANIKPELFNPEEIIGG